MSRDYKPKPNSGPKRGGSMFAGILIGFILGLAVALGIAWYINKMPSPFVSHEQPDEKQPAAPPAPQAATTPPDDKKPRFDFYKILPGQENPVTQRAASEPAPAAPSSPTTESYYLQAGSFQKKEDADNMKAKLAMIGLESEIQTGAGGESKYRVRIGPYPSENDLGKIRDELQQNGIASTTVKIKATGQ